MQLELNTVARNGRNVFAVLRDGEEVRAFGTKSDAYAFMDALFETRSPVDRAVESMWDQRIF